MNALNRVVRLQQIRLAGAGASAAHIDASHGSLFTAVNDGDAGVLTRDVTDRKAHVGESLHGANP
ncbi:hypothetical protein GCM10009604_01420 [Corynebacterium aurimucosum]